MRRDELRERLSWVAFIAAPMAAAMIGGHYVGLPMEGRLLAGALGPAAMAALTLWNQRTEAQDA